MPIDEGSISHLGPSDKNARFDYKCGHCDRNVTGRVVSYYFFKTSSSPFEGFNSISFLICPSCSRGSVLHSIDDEEDIIPGAKPGDKLFDSHSGSGSFRIAAYDMGFDLISCELDADYCRDNQARFERHIQQMDLFTPEEIQENIYIDKELFNE